MKEIWTKDPEQMAVFFEELIRTKTAMTFSQKNLTPQKVIAETVERKKSFSLLILKKVGMFQCDRNEPIFLLIRSNTFLTYIFQSGILQEDAQTILLIFPQAIFQVQLRKYPRVTTPENSSIVFAPHGGTRLCSGQLKDVSLEGAFCVGNFSSTIAKKNCKIGHVTFNLTMKNALLHPSKVFIPSSQIIRVVEGGCNIIGIGLQFKAEGDDLIVLENYIESRFIEDSVR